MRFMVLLKADKTTEAGVLPDEKLLTEMGKYNECPNPLGGEAEIEIRQVFEAEDFGGEAEERMRAQVTAKRG